jgi:hypothetical protein
MRYEVFISYSHTADRKLAPAIQYGLNWIDTPWHHLPSIRALRDLSDSGGRTG